MALTRSCGPDWLDAAMSRACVLSSSMRAVACSMPTN